MPNPWTRIRDPQTEEDDIHNDWVDHNLASGDPAPETLEQFTEREWGASPPPEENFQRMMRKLVPSWMLGGKALTQTERDMMAGKQLSGWSRPRDPIPDPEYEPEPTRGQANKEKVMRFDGDWEQTPTGVRLVKKNIRYEER